VMDTGNNRVEEFTAMGLLVLTFGCLMNPAWCCEVRDMCGGAGTD